MTQVVEVLWWLYKCKHFSDIKVQPPEDKPSNCPKQFFNLTKRIQSLPFRIFQNVRLPSAHLSPPRLDSPLGHSIQRLAVPIPSRQRFVLLLSQHRLCFIFNGLETWWPLSDLRRLRNFRKEINQYPTIRQFKSCNTSTVNSIQWCSSIIIYSFVMKRI